MSNAFKLTETELAVIAPAGGRVAKPSIYLQEVKDAIASPDEAYGIAVPEGTKGSRIVSELQKAATALDVKLKVWNRETAPTPFVGFKIKPAAAPEAKSGK